uniref:hypothetical protein n=1 Tax=Gluconobacter thailandicus TaxID=257438 RepID=UPI00077736E7|nr:hypothetical protein [Gluconobacter thailandicus]
MASRPTLTLPDYARPDGDVPALASGSLSDLLTNHVAVAQHDAQCQADKARLWAYLHGLRGFDVVP